MIKLIIFNAFLATVDIVFASKSCPRLLEGVSLEFVDEPGRVLEIKNGKPLSCKRIFECNIMTTPPESTVYWYKNDNLIHASVSRDLTLSSPYHDSHENPVLGISEQRHRICLDSLIDYDHHSFEFKCRVQSSCNSLNVIESKPIIVESSDKNNKFNSHTNRYYKVPLITLISSSRLEIAGNFIQLFCNAVGNPKPEINWKLIDNNDETISHDIDNYSFIWEQGNGNIIIDTMKTQEATLTFECTAKNKFGKDNAYSSVMLVDGN